MVIDPDRPLYDNAKDEAIPKYDSKSNKKPACDYCKKRKIKCDGLVDCFQCQKRALKCTYEGPAPLPKNGIIAKLTSRLNQLSSELEEQKRIANYYRTLYETKEVKKSRIIPIIREKKPHFCQRSSDLCRHVASAVSTVLKAFNIVMKPPLLNNDTEFCLDYSMLLWNRLINSEPEDFFNKSSVLPTESLVSLLIHSSMFSIGSSLLQYADLALHFRTISEHITPALTSTKSFASIDPDLVRQLNLALLYSIFFYIINADYNNARLHWLRARDFLTQHDCDPEVVIWMAVLAPDPGAHETWIKRLATTTIKPKPFLAYLCVANIGLTKFSADYDVTRQWACINSLEEMLNRLQGSMDYNFLAVWIYGLKAISAVTLPPGQDNSAEVSQCINIVTQMYGQMPYPAQQMWISRWFEYLYHALSNRQLVNSLSTCLNQILDVLYHLVILLTPPDEMDYESYPGVMKDESRTFVHPLIQHSPLASIN